MTYTPIYQPRRRRPRRRPYWGVAALVLGMLALVAAADWPRRGQETPVPEPKPAVGHLLHAGKHSALVLGVLPLRSGDVLAAVRFVRGPNGGTVAYRVQGCPDGGALRELGSGIRWGWERGQPGIFDAVAAVACGEPAAVACGEPAAVGVAS